MKNQSHELHLHRPRCACVHHVAMLAIVELLAIRRHAARLHPTNLLIWASSFTCLLAWLLACLLTSYIKCVEIGGGEWKISFQLTSQLLFTSRRGHFRVERKVAASCQLSKLQTRKRYKASNWLSHSHSLPKCKLLVNHHLCLHESLSPTLA